MAKNQDGRSASKSSGRDVAECFGENLKRLRAERNWTQAELAERTGLSKGFLQSLEAGRRWVSPITLRALSVELGVSQSELFRDCLDEGRPDAHTLFRWVGEALGVEVSPEFWRELKIRR